ncbi:hypothetical protein QBC45DRAFT_388775 [Copromyces sp. CBS 386.78]|nr:hypothetical protein QBC45DRAFT_388775 [Copromyces sp. CBS 386.78]
MRFPRSVMGRTNMEYLLNRLFHRIRTFESARYKREKRRFFNAHRNFQSWYVRWQWTMNQSCKGLSEKRSSSITIDNTRAATTKAKNNESSMPSSSSSSSSFLQNMKQDEDEDDEIFAYFPLTMTIPRMLLEDWNNKMEDFVEQLSDLIRVVEYKKRVKYKIGIEEGEEYAIWHITLSRITIDTSWSEAYLGWRRAEEVPRYIS